MILVDTSIWIDHFHRADELLAQQLEADEVGCHPLVIEELALGTLERRADVLRLLGSLGGFPTLGHDEVLALVDAHRLCGRGLSAADVHLLGSVLITPGAKMWTRDKRLVAACRELDLPCIPSW